MPNVLSSARFWLAFGMTAMPFMVAGCGNKDAATAQLVAKVDGQDIEITRMKSVLANAKGVSPENISDTKLEILNGLVEQQLAINLAIANKLDRKPEVLNAIEASRREILARAALDQIADELPAVSDDEVKKYYAENPALFSGRRLFTLQEIVLKKSPSDLAAIRAQVASAKSMEDVSAWLRDRKMEFSSTISIKAAEQIAPAVLLKLQTFKDGQIGLIESPDAYTITHLMASYAQPIGIVKGMPAAAVFLRNLRAAEAVKQARIDMRAKAKLEYFGEFAGGEAAFKARAEADAKAAAEATAQTNAKSKAEVDAVSAQLANQEAEQLARDKARAQSNSWQAPSRAEAIIVEKGIKGL